MHRELKILIAKILRKEYFAISVEVIENIEEAKFMHLTCHFISDQFNRETLTLSCEYTKLNWPPEVSSSALKVIDSLKLSLNCLCSLTSLQSIHIKEILVSPARPVVRVNCLAEILMEIVNVSLSHIEFPGLSYALYKAQQCFISFRSNDENREKLKELGLSELASEFCEKSIDELYYSTWRLYWNIWATVRQLKPVYAQFYEFLDEECACLSDEQWRLCEAYHAAVVPIAAVLEEILNGSNFIHISAIPYFVFYIRSELNKIPSDSDPTLILLRDSLLKKVFAYFNWTETSDDSPAWNDYSRASLFAAALDPRFKSLQGLSADSQAFIWANIKALLDGELSETVPPQSTDSQNVGVFSSMVQDSSSSGSPVEREIRRYRAETPLHVNAIIDGKKSFSDPLQWWKGRDIIYPRLAALARRWLCIPAFSKAPELFYCAYSERGDDLRRRNELPSSTLGSIVFVGDCLNLLKSDDISHMFLGLNRNTTDQK